MRRTHTHPHTHSLYSIHGHTLTHAQAHTGRQKHDMQSFFLSRHPGTHFPWPLPPLHHTAKTAKMGLCACACAYCWDECVCVCVEQVQVAAQEPGSASANQGVISIRGREGGPFCWHRGTIVAINTPTEQRAHTHSHTQRVRKRQSVSSPVFTSCKIQKCHGLQSWLRRARRPGGRPPAGSDRWLLL